MILLLLVVIVVVGLAGAGVLGVGLLSADRRADRSGLAAVLTAPAVLVVSLLLLAALRLLFAGVQQEDDGHPPPRARPTTTALPSARIIPSRTALPTVSIVPDRDDRFSDYRMVSGLAPGSVVRVRADGFGWAEAGRVEQCVVELGRQTACGEAFPVQFGEQGRADFQVAIRGDVSPGGCRAGQPTCLLRLTGLSSGRTGAVQTVLVDDVSPGRVQVEPATKLTDGQAIEVRVTGFPPGTSAAAVLCAPPGPYDALRCSVPSALFSLDGGGGGRTTLAVTAGLCGLRRPCGVTVLVGSGFMSAPVAPVSFAAGPGVDYEGGRVLTGVLIAGVLLLIAMVVARRTDWARPTEAATPELDAADLRTDEGLDDLFGTDRELDERDPIPW